jgi:hypothetical protein
MIIAACSIVMFAFVRPRSASVVEPQGQQAVTSRT